ncbi:Heme d1 biosynthesis protein NirD / Heme d1 biosynthesis protein NirL [hydrothermal vent metagenome]|uniref:siroheme decarboxylase n=1 Tax=hydrothermal vent metagenome TaxID=652676 RepID=A0A3B0XYU8_9ZZZZ
MKSLQLNPLEKRVLNEYQQNMPLCEQPYLEMASQLGVSESTLLSTLEKLKQQGAISRIGAVFRANSVGVSTLAAMQVPKAQLTAVAATVSAYPQVSHNYEREHDFNMWFVVIASDQQQLKGILNNIERDTGYPVMVLPMIKDYHIDLGFDLKW